MKNFHDTQLYEMVIDDKSKVSYQFLVDKYLRKKISKNSSMSNWEMRPLTEEQLSYAAEDVTHLRDIYKMQIKKLRELGRVGWLEDELQQMARIREKSAGAADIQNIGSGTGNSAGNGNNNSEIYNQLNEWRVAKAKQLQVSEEFIVRTSILKAICKIGGDFICKMRNSRRTQGKTLLDFLDFAEKITAGMKVETENEQLAENKAIFYALKAILETCARSNNIVPHLIAKSKDLEEISSGILEGKCFSGWRKTVFGDAVAAFLRENALLHMENDKLMLTLNNAVKIPCKTTS